MVKASDWDQKNQDSSPSSVGEHELVSLTHHHVAACCALPFVSNVSGRCLWVLGIFPKNFISFVCEGHYS